MRVTSSEAPLISVGQLRQNPTEMIRAVRQGGEYVLTDRGVPTARIIPYCPQRWVPADEVRDVLTEFADPEWVADIEAFREDNILTDPWESQ
ncbi:MAG: type II toxin-antitoxin system prevent-host-death family antitoxin [Propionibacteriaceae bacterium]|nr:type II toxin-antitoxin system prevent-host-death family antitoxin [Propionibacteriaceae bacterium]